MKIRFVKMQIEYHNIPYFCIKFALSDVFMKKKIERIRKAITYKKTTKMATVRSSTVFIITYILFDFYPDFL